MDWLSGGLISEGLDWFVLCGFVFVTWGVGEKWSRDGVHREGRTRLFMDREGRTWLFIAWIRKSKAHGKGRLRARCSRQRV